MVDATKLAQWRLDLQGGDPVRMLNVMPQVARSGWREAVELLEGAGRLLPPTFWDTPIDLDSETITAREFRDRWLTTLRESLPHEAHALGGDADATLAFISYSTVDRVEATQLAVALTQGEGRRVFLDHWQLAAGERLSDRLAASVGEARALVLLLSASSMQSHWVKHEIELAMQRMAADPRFHIVPVRLDDEPLTEPLADMVHVDWREGRDLDEVAQAVLDRLRGDKPFSARVNDLLAGTDTDPNPYDEQHVRAGRALLPLLASKSALVPEANQRWLLWELLHAVARKYTCTIKIRRDEPTGVVEFEVRDRWLETMNLLKLDAEQVKRGLWSLEFNPARTKAWGGADARFLGSTGRISYRSECRPRPSANPIHVAKPVAMQVVLAELQQAMQPLGKPARQSFVFDFQSLVLHARWRRIELVAGAAHVDISLAHSPMVRSEHAPNGGPGVTLELWDNFLGAMKSTQLHDDQLAHPWEADIDLFSPEWETPLGLA